MPVTTYPQIADLVLNFTQATINWPPKQALALARCHSHSPPATRRFHGKQLPMLHTRNALPGRSRSARPTAS